MIVEQCFNCKKEKQIEKPARSMIAIISITARINADLFRYVLFLINSVIMNQQQK